MQNIYRLNLAERLGYKPHVFTVCAAAARDVPVFQFSRPLDFDALSQSIELLEKSFIGHVLAFLTQSKMRTARSVSLALAG